MPHLITIFSVLYLSVYPYYLYEYIYVYEYHLYSQNCNLTATIIYCLHGCTSLGQWHEKEDRGVTTRLLAVYTRVGLNAGSANLHGLFFTRVQIPHVQQGQIGYLGDHVNLTGIYAVYLHGYIALAHRSLHSLS